MSLEATPGRRLVGWLVTLSDFHSVGVSGSSNALRVGLYGGSNALQKHLQMIEVECAQKPGGVRMHKCFSGCVDKAAMLKNV